MGLTAESTGRGAIDSNLLIDRGSKVIALAGNPNVGKSTVFNELTGLNQHTGNWPGKTVTNAQGKYIHNGTEYVLVDLPGTYSLMAHSTEEEVARDFICFGNPDAVIVVCDATCLERNLNLVLQTIEITDKVVVCVNLLDEAKKNLQLYNVSANILHASGESLPFDDNSFDCIISRNVTWTLLDTKQSYQEWLRVLRPGGKILIFDANWNLKYHDKK